MTLEEHERLFELITNPPPGSEIEAAKRFGVDLTLLLRNLTLTPDERVKEMENALSFAENLRKPGSSAMMTTFEAALRALDEAGVNFIIVGAYAAYAQGSNHLTRDLDICYERAPENLKRLVQALSPLHPRLRGTPDNVPFVFDERTLSQGMNFTLQTDLGDIDLFGELSGIGSFSELAHDAVSVDLHGKSFRVASLGAIIRSKKAAGRPKDLLVLQELEALRESKSSQSGQKKKSS
jgi:predicted nucleotidyltransferase